MTTNKRVGANIDRIRNKRGLTQGQLASLAGISRSRLSLVENGKETPSAAWVAVVASALNVDADVLYGRRDPELDQLDRVVPTIRRVVATTDPLPDIDPLPLDELARMVSDVAKWRHAASYDRIADLLPDLTDQLLAATQRDGTPVYQLLVTTYRAGNTLSHKMGHHDLSMVATDRMLWAAERADDPLLVATTQYVRSAALVRVGATRQAIQLTDRTIADVEPLVGEPGGAAVLSALHMRRAGLAAMFSDADTSATHFAEAHRHAAGVEDGKAYETVVGPTNVKLFELSAAVDLGDIGRALVVRDNVRMPADYPRERQAHFWLDVCRAALAAGEPDKAVEALANAKEAAPEYFRKSKAVNLALDATGERLPYVNDTYRALASYAGSAD